MTVKELIKALESMDEDKRISVAVNTPVPGGVSMGSGSLQIKEGDQSVAFIVTSHS